MHAKLHAHVYLHVHAYLCNAMHDTADLWLTESVKAQHNNNAFDEYVNKRCKRVVKFDG